MVRREEEWMIEQGWEAWLELARRGLPNVEFVRCKNQLVKRRQARPTIDSIRQRFSPVGTGIQETSKLPIPALRS